MIFPGQPCRTRGEGTRGGEVERTITLVRKVMEEAPHPLLSLAVPLHVDAKAAQNWDEAH